MKKRVLSILLCAVMLVSLLPVTAGATGICDHSDWTAVTMGETHIKLGTTEQNSNTLPEGSYYLDSEITVPLTISGSVNLCLNGKSITVSDDFAIKINSDASLTLSDCGTGGKVTNSGSSSYSYGIYNSGTFILNSGTVEATGSSGRGVYNASSRTVYIAGGVITGTQHGIYNYSSSNKVYLSGEPAISGTTADIYTDSSYSYIYANDGADTPTAYNGNEITLAYWYLDNDYTLVRNVTAANKNKFTLTDTNYQLGFDEEDGILTTQGKPQTLIWYAADGESVLTGDGYPSTWPYGEYLYTSDLPVGSVVAEKAFLGWLYRDSGNSTWSTSCWSSDLIESAKEFKAEYVDSFAGSGTKDDPYQISTASDLQKMATVVNSGNTAYNNSNIHYKLMGSIDLSSVCGSGIGSWTPIGDYDNTYVKFSANFDGNNQTISNLYINTSDSYQGLFGYVYGNYSSNVSIKNLNLDNVSVSSSGSKVGAVAGYADYAKITGCSVTGSVSGDDDCGALVGYPYDCTLEYNNTSGVAVSPHGYTVDENGVMAHKTRYSNAIDIKGNYKENWIQTTYGDYGYEVTSSGLNGAEVTSAAEFINDGKYIQLNYTVEAGSSAISGGKLAVHADVQIGDNDSAAMEVIQDASGKVIGLKMVDTHTGSCTSKDAQFNLYFDGTGGVTPVSTYWFGYYNSRSSHYYDNLTQSTLASGSNGEYTLEDGVYTKLSGTDSGFAISWQDISLEANESKTFSFVLGVGEKADPPEWGSNGVYLTLNAQQTGKIIDVSAKVRDAAGLTDTLYYSVDGDDGIDLGDVSADGTVKTLAGQLDLAIYEPGTYSFSFWVVNSKGAASASVVREITINGDGSITGLDTEVPVTHTVTFDAQSGSAVDAITVDNGGTIATLPESTRNGFTFGGWYTEPGGVGALLTNETTITANITYYAKWTENTPAPVTYTVTVQNDGNGTATASPASAEAGTQIALTATPNDGYHFKEWQDLPVGVTVSDNKFTMPAADVTVRAIFEADVPTTYTVTYDANGGSGTVVDDTEYESGDAVTLKSGSGLTMDGYSFAGWNTEANGSGTPYSAGDTYTIADDTYFYAQWTQNEGEKDAAVDNTAAGSYAGTTVSGWGDLATKDETGNAYAPNVVVEVKLTVTAQTENSAPEAEVTAIKNAASGKTLQFLDLTLSKTVNGSPISDFGSRNNQVLEIKIPFTVGNKQNITVYRYHGSGASPFNPLNTRPASAWEDGKFYVDSINNAIYIYAKQFSTYAIGYTVPAPAPTPNPPIYVPVVHYCISKCDICGGCEDAKCTHSACKNKCLLLGMNFTDVAEGKWYTEPVAYVYHHGMMEGVGNNLFDINGTTTRAMIVTILWRLEGEPVVNYLMQFEDVAAETWYTEAVRWAASEKIVEGYSDTAFGPTEPITREQFATILWRYAKYKGYDVSVGEDTNILSYEDAFSVSEYAIPAMQWACGAGLMQGDGVNLTPKAEATRAQAAALFQRFCENVAEK